MSVRYRVYVQPLYSAFVYLPEIDISDLVEDVAGTITKSIDSTDFSVGIYTFNDVQLTCDNSDGRLSDTSDSRSIFPFSRDRAKIRIVFDNGDSVPPTTYKGVISDSATEISSDTDELTFTILGPDSVLNNSMVPAGSIADGATVLQAMIAILSTSDITSVLNVSFSNLNPQNNIVIDDGSKFDNLNKNSAMTQLLGVSNSVMIIDANNNVIVRDRQPNFSNPITYLYGKGDQFGRENIKSIQSYNTGLQRTFNSILVTGGQATAVVTDIDSVEQTVTKETQTGSASQLTSQALYGLRQKAISFAFITDPTTLALIAQGYIDEFAFPKIELEVIVSTGDVVDTDLLDEVSVNYPLLVTPSGKFLPIIGVTKIGDTDSPLPYVKGAISIDSSLGFKIIEKTEDISAYETTLKIRQIGSTLTDGGLIVPTSTRTITTSGPILTSDDLILLDCTAGNVDITLPSPLANPQKMYTVIRIDATANRGRVLPFNVELINQGSSVTLANQNDSAQFGTDRTNWWSYAIAKQPISIIPKTNFTLTNNQSSPANVDSLSFDKTVYRTAIIKIDVRRKTDTASSEVRATHYVHASYNLQADTWSILDSPQGDDDGIVLSITNAGQMQYTSTNITGANGIHNAYFNAELFGV